MTQHQPFTLLSRILHWTMAALILVMLFIGIALTDKSEYKPDLDRKLADEAAQQGAK